MRLEGIKKILIVNFGGIGDILLSKPALSALKNLYTEAEISILVAPHIVEITKTIPFIKEVIPFHFITDKSHGGKHFFNFKRVKDVIQLLYTLRKKKFDIAINMRTITSTPSAFKMAIIFFIINAKLNVGRDTDKRGFFFNVKIPETYVGKMHEMEYDLETVKTLGADISNKEINLHISPSNQNKIEELLKNNGVDKSDTLIGIHPGGIISRRWPIENFIKVIGILTEKLNCKIAITGGQSEVNLSQQFKKKPNNKVINFIGKIDMVELIALIKRCNIYITNDTGPMHIAAVLKTPMIAIF